jgi:GNAT superfamily N-acetyltransferase
VLREGRAHEGFPEDDDAATVHLAAVEGDHVVGVATFVPRDDGWWQLRGMAVDAERQGRGIGRAILDEAESRLRALGASGVWANGRDTALGFYERAGWRVVGDGYDMKGRPHHRVERCFD